MILCNALPLMSATSQSRQRLSRFAAPHRVISRPCSLLSGCALAGAAIVEERVVPDPESEYEEGEKYFRLGCLTLEKTLRPHSDYVDPEEGFQDMGIYFDRARSAFSTRLDSVLRIDYITACMPLFRSRKEVLSRPGGKISDIPKTAIKESRLNLGRLYEDLDALPWGDDYAYNLSKVGLSLAIMRTGMPAFPSTFREMCNSRPDMTSDVRKRYAHSTYTIDDRHRKTPIRALHKRQSQRINALTVSMPFGEVIKQAIGRTLPELAGSGIPLIETTQLVVGLLAEEAKGNTPDGTGLQLLDRVSDRVQGLLAHYQETTLRTLRH